MSQHSFEEKYAAGELFWTMMRDGQTGKPIAMKGCDQRAPRLYPSGKVAYWSDIELI